MQRADELRRTLDSVTDLKSVVRTMKSLSAVNISHFESAARSIRDYQRTIDMSLQIAFRHRDVREFFAAPDFGVCAAIVFGSAHGLCGRFNEAITEHMLSVLNTYNIDIEDRIIFTVGDRAAAAVRDEGQSVRTSIPITGSIGEVTAVLQSLLDTVMELQSSENTDHVFLFYNELVSKSGYKPATSMLIPLGFERLETVAQREWDGPSLPIHFGSWQTMFDHVVRQHLFSRLYGAVVQSLAAENAARLAAMQAAENNIDDRLSELRSAYNRQRQSAITTELIDIASGFEALRQDSR